MNIKHTLYFAFNQFYIGDKACNQEIPEWTQALLNQGFARRPSVIAVATLTQDGEAPITVTVGQYQPSDKNTRVIQTPFFAKSGEIVVYGPEENPNERTDYTISPGNYRLTIAQNQIDEENIEVDIYFEPTKALDEQSKIIVADDMLSPNYPLIETASLVM
jgi:hypothetical protein